MKEIIIYGLGSIAELAKFYFDNDSDYKVVAFTVEKSYYDKAEFQGLPVVVFEELESIYPPSMCQLFIAISYTNMNKLRESKYLEGKQRGYKFANYISSKATVWTDKIGDNNFILEDNTLQPFTIIGNNNMIWSGNHIGHHGSIGNNNFISSHVVISGMVHIKNNCFLGVNSTLRNNITIADRTIIGAGAVILKSIGENEVYATRQTELFPKTSDQVKL
ncbi:MAG: sugar O-acyltransferase [Burkholderiales bacterium]|jgi:sugar O-acyltransferase (sialic acid O-acetyltransferase NeuD family)|nr:sugar O-acyltransferase [Burkholderiales bacterium]MCE3268192.1 sugar O-acyltransferase [Burkholderiales bacterium]